MARVEQGTGEEEAAAGVQVAPGGAGKGAGRGGRRSGSFEGGGFLSVGCEGVRRVKEPTFILWSVV